MAKFNPLSQAAAMHRYGSLININPYRTEVEVKEKNVYSWYHNNAKESKPSESVIKIRFAL